MNSNFEDLMREATRLTRSGLLAEATQVLQHGLGSSVPRTFAEPRMPAKPTASAWQARSAGPLYGGTRVEPGRDDSHGSVRSGAHTHLNLTREYRLYMPPQKHRGARPLVVMLHGCTQNPDDFAAGTGMDIRAREQGFYVLYPAQAQKANAGGCWNWFKPNHQRHGAGEPALLASLTLEVMKDHDIDVRRVYVAGLSAGGAMAAITAQAYPNLFAALGVHSGLPPGSAHDAMSALAVMKSGQAEPGPGRTQPLCAPQAEPGASSIFVPTIVFHGDQDTTVHPRNGEQIVAATLQSAVDGGPGSGTPLRVEQGASMQGRPFTRQVHVASDGASLAEHWLVHGAGHAWSGGQAAGSYTDPRGPDATAEMLRFFFEHPRREAAS
jgi:poly(hydroxyalkanoate) depolymerase family esterase